MSRWVRCRIVYSILRTRRAVETRASERRRVFADAFLARAQASLEDLEVRQALRKFADL